MPGVSGVVEVDDGFKSLHSLAESMAIFFKKRADLDAQYIEGLDKLLAKQEESDRRHDTLFHDTSLLQAWNQIKSVAYAEIVERRQLLYSLQHSVMEPLVTFKDQKERQRKRIKEEVSTSATEHADYKAHTLRLKRAYQRKSEEVRQLSTSIAEYDAANLASGSTSPTSTGSGGTAHPASNSGAGGSSIPGPHTATGAAASTSSGAGSAVPGFQVIHPVASSVPHASSAGGTAGTSGNAGAGPDRVLISGATSSSLRDAHSPPPINNPAIAAIKSSRVQLNNLINKLGSRTSGGSSSSVSGEGSTGAGSAHGGRPGHLSSAKLSKARREAEESNANYRSALHHLETLRMQRERVSKASLGSLHEFCFELGSTCKSIFAQYCDHCSGKARKTEKSLDVARQTAYTIAPEEDVHRFSAAANVAVFYEDPLPYENYHVGVSYSLIFGVSLTEYSASNDGVLVPLTVQRAILEIDSRGLDTEGIYRVPGKLALIQQVVQSIEQDEITFEFDSDKHDVHTVAGVLKLYLRQLPEPLLSIDSKEREAISSASDEEAFKMASKRLRKMTPAHQATAKMLIAHFARVLAHGGQNKMTAQALSLCLNPVVFPEETSLSAFGGHKDRCLEYLIANRQELFSGLPASSDLNSPYRKYSIRRNASGVDLEDDDDDPPLRRSQESVKLRSSSGSSATANMPHFYSQQHHPHPLYQSSQVPYSDTASLAPTYRTAPMEMLGSALAVQGAMPIERLSSTSTSASSSDIHSSLSSHLTYGNPATTLASPPPPATYSSNSVDLGSHVPALAHVPAPIPVPAPIASPTTAAMLYDPPKRTLSLSQRARSGSASIANAMKSLGRSRSPIIAQYPASVSTTTTSSPVSPQQPPQLSNLAVSNAGEMQDDDSIIDTPVTVRAPAPFQLPPSPAPAPALSLPPLEPPPPLSPTPLPAGAAPLLGRPPSLTSSTSSLSAIATPGLADTQPVLAVGSPTPPSNIDPDSVYETYHKAGQDSRRSSASR